MPGDTNTQVRTSTLDQPETDAGQEPGSDHRNPEPAHLRAVIHATHSATGPAESAIRSGRM
jgi:hypothetical protein